MFVFCRKSMKVNGALGKPSTYRQNRKSIQNISIINKIINKNIYIIRFVRVIGVL